MTWTAFYLPNAEAELVFAGHAVGAGALIENGAVVSATSDARALGVQPGMPLRTAFAFAPALTVLKRTEPRLPPWLSVQRSSLAPLVGRVRSACGLFDAGDVLITAQLLSDLEVRTAPAGPVPAALRIGTGPGEAEAVLAALSGQRRLTHEEADRLRLSDCLPAMDQPVAGTIAELVSAPSSSLQPAAAELRRLLLDDGSALRDIRLGDTFELRMPIAGHLPGAELKLRLSESAAALSGWLAARGIQPGRISLTLETGAGKVMLEVEPSAGTADAILAELIRSLRKEPHADIRAFTLRPETKRTDDRGPAACGLAADLAARLGSGRVYRLPCAEDGFPGSVRRLNGTLPAVSEEQPLPERTILPAMVRRDAVPLRAEHGVPCWEGPLTLLKGPTFRRIGSEEREYWTAKTEAGRRVWLWKTPGAGNWHLQGLFT